MGTWLRYEIQQCHCFIAPSAHTSNLNLNLSPLKQITIQILIHLSQLQKYSTIPSTWRWYSKNPDILAFEKNSL